MMYELFNLCLHAHLIDTSSKLKVLLYKFFEDSTVDLSQWRVVLNLLGDESNLNIPAPCFEESRHAGVCSEVGQKRQPF